MKNVNYRTKGGNVIGVAHSNHDGDPQLPKIFAECGGCRGRWSALGPVGIEEKLRQIMQHATSCHAL